MTPLLNHLWQSTVFAALIALVALLFRRNAAGVRYWLWWSASLKFLIPFSLLMSLGNQFEWAPPAGPMARLLPGPAIVERVSQAAPVVLESVAVASRPFLQSAPPDRPLSERTVWVPVAAVVIWACGFAAIAWMRLRGWLRIRSALDLSTPLDIGAPVPVRSSPGLLEPGIVGWFRPTLLVPVGIEKRLSHTQLTVVIAHELSHLHRRDNFTAGLHMVVEALFWFHPLVWWIGSRLVAERERACDEAVLELGCEPREYAEAILAVCRYYVESPLICVSGIKGSDIANRIEMIIRNPVVSRMSWAKKAVLAIAATFAVAAPILAGVMAAGSSRTQSPEPALSESPDGQVIGSNVIDSSSVHSIEAANAGMQIAGVVLQTSTALPIVEADVSLERLPDEGPRILSPAIPRNIVGLAKTDFRGRFVFGGLAPGEYHVQVQKEGYSPPEPMAATAAVILDADHQNPAPLKFLLSRPGELYGRLVERDSGKPAAALLVHACWLTYRSGRTIPFPRRNTRTDADGHFVISGLPPGEYVLWTGSRFHAPRARNVAPEVTEAGMDYLVTDLSEEDTETTSWDYEQGYWPGGPSLEQAIPVTVIGDSSIDLGDIALPRTPVYSVRISLVNPSCTPDETLTINVRAPDPLLPSLRGHILCGEDFRLHGFQPGSYRLELGVQGRQRTTRVRGSARFTIATEDIEIAVPVSLGVDVEGKILPAEGSQSPDFSRIQLHLSPVGWPGYVDERTNPIDGEGRFRIPNVAVREQQLFLSGLSPSHYLKEIRYNGHTVRGDVLTMDSYAGEHSLEIIVNDKPASVSGSVTDGDKPVDRPFVVLTRWPLNPADPYQSLTTAVGEADGKFRLVGLAPGEYRIVAVLGAARESIQKRGQLDRALRRAEKLILAPRDVQVLNVELTEQW